MYTSHLGPRESPFSITPDPRYLYLSARHQEALAHLLYGVGEAGGFVQLTGEVGTGKTTMCRSLLEQLPPEVDVALVLNPRLTALELLATVCDELRIAYPAGTESLKALVDALYRRLLGAHARGRRTVLIIDEAQNLAPDVLEQVRLLTNLETAREKLLQIILIGQPELGQMLERPELRQLAQRVTARYHLLPFAPGETRAYVRHRLEVAGVDEVSFSEGALREVHRLSRGVPRLINVICDRAMLGAFAHDRRRIDGRIVRRAAGEVLGRGVRPRFARALGWSAAGALLVLAAGAGWLWLAGGPGAFTPTRTGLTHRGATAASGGTSPPAGAGDAAAPGRASASGEVAFPPPTVPPPARGAPDRQLAALLGDGALRADRHAAFAVLYELWRVETPRTPDVDPCEGPRPGGLECLARTGTWTRLRRLNLPAVLDLRSPAGTRHYAAITALEPDSARLHVDGRTLTVALVEVEPFWDGGFVALWKPPAPGVTAIGPNARGRDVEWLRRRLAALDHQPITTRRPDVYDEGLRERVMAFQRERGLLPDGIAGEETLTQLGAALGEPGVPRLAAPRT